MQNFEFKNPTKIIFGKGQIASLSREISKDTKLMITYGGGSIMRNGVYDQVKKALNGYNYVEFGSIEPNPRYHTLMKAVKLAQEESIDMILAVGGGSVVDGSKFIATAINYTETNEPWDFMVNQSLYEGVTPVPIAAIITLPATGSEMNCAAVVSNDETGEKLAFKHPQNFPQFSILDPEVCYTLPIKQRANGIVDTFCHTLEQYLTYPTDSRIQDRFAEGILLTLKEIGTRVINENDYDTLANYMLSATMGLNGFVGMGVPQDWATHMIGHELTAMFGLDHGVTLAIVGPSLMNVMREEKKGKLLQYGERVWGINAGDENERIDQTIKATIKFYESVGIKCKLTDYNIDNSKFEEIAERFRQRGWVLGENSSITPEKVIEILNGAL